MLEGGASDNKSGSYKKSNGLIHTLFSEVKNTISAIYMSVSCVKLPYDEFGCLLCLYHIILEIHACRNPSPCHDKVLLSVVWQSNCSLSVASDGKHFSFTIEFYFILAFSDILSYSNVLKF